jgi:hypothetical protein
MEMLKKHIKIMKMGDACIATIFATLCTTCRLLPNILNMLQAFPPLLQPYLMPIDYHQTFKNLLCFFFLVGQKVIYPHMS